MSNSSDNSGDHKGEKPSSYLTSGHERPESELKSHGSNLRSPFHKLANSYAGKTKETSKGWRLPFLVLALIVGSVSIIFLRGKESAIDSVGGDAVDRSGDGTGEVSVRSQLTENEALHSRPRLSVANTTGEITSDGPNITAENNVPQSSSLPKIGHNSDASPNDDKSDLRIEVNPYSGAIKDDIFSAKIQWRIPEREPDAPDRIEQSVIIKEQAVASQFEDDGLLSSVDPKAKYITLLEYHDINLTEVPVETRYLAIVALNELIGRHSQIARNSLKTLKAYLEAADLHEDYIAYLSNTTHSRQSISFQEGLQMATAYVMSPIGHEDYQYRLVGVDDGLKDRVASTLMQLCMKEWPELVKQRNDIHAIGSFLESVDKVDGYFAWSEDYAQRQLAERREQMVMARDDRDLKEEMNRLNILEIQRERDVRSQELRMKRMEYAMKLRQEAIRSDAAIRIARYMRNWGYYPSLHAGTYYTNRD